MLVIAVAPVARVGSPIDSGSRSGLAPNTPDSYTSCRSRATVRWARLHTMLGSPTPTTQFFAPSRPRADAAIIISVLNTRDRARPGRPRLPSGAQLHRQRI